ncbi:MAG TPA: AraC family transcriptional regulator [Scandinavium sp.]|jgi:AraC family transcriptional activator of mar-sox-rob regulon
MIVPNTVNLDIAAAVVRDIIVWIEDDLSKPMSIKSVAAKAGYSPWHFQRIFSIHVGISIARYIRTLRVEYAAEMLKAIDTPVADICNSVGFEDSSVFGRAFRLRYGMTPSEYRELTYAS